MKNNSNQKSPRVLVPAAMRCATLPVRSGQCHPRPSATCGKRVENNKTRSYQTKPAKQHLPTRKQTNTKQKQPGVGSWANLQDRGPRRHTRPDRRADGTRTTANWYNGERHLVPLYHTAPTRGTRTRNHAQTARTQTRQSPSGSDTHAPPPTSVTGDGSHRDATHGVTTSTSFLSPLVSSNRWSPQRARSGARRQQKHNLSALRTSVRPRHTPSALISGIRSTGRRPPRAPRLPAAGCPTLPPSCMRSLDGPFTLLAMPQRPPAACFLHPPSRLSSRGC
jgi:hypothetical protein